MILSHSPGRKVTSLDLAGFVPSGHIKTVPDSTCGNKAVGTSQQKLRADEAVSGAVE